MNNNIITFISILCIRIIGSFYTEKDLSVIGFLAKYFHSSNIIFVENGADVSLLKRFQEFLDSGYYYTVFNSYVLKDILENDALQVGFFDKRSIIITKEQLNLTELLDKVLLPHYLTWIIFGSNRIHKTFYIPVSCNVLFVNSENESVLFEEVYHLKRGYEPVETSLSVAMPNSVGKLSLEKEETFSLPSRKVNFRNMSLNLQILESRAECQKEEGEIMKRLSCIHQILLTMVGLRLNYSVNFVECKEKEYPFFFPNGTESELFMKIKDREVDFSSAITHVAEGSFRRPYIDYVWPTFVLKTMMYLRQARTTGRWRSYLKPLEPSVWWGILGCIAVTGVLVKIFENLLANTLKFDLSLFHELIMSIFRSLQVFCNQAIEDPSTSYSIRMILILKFFVVFIFFQAYCGYLVSSLAVVIMRFPFTDLNGFLQNREYRVMTLKKGFHRYFFRRIILHGNDEKLMLPDDDLPLTMQEAMDKLCTEEYLALGGFREDMLNFDSLSCKISELPLPLVHSYFGIGVHKKAPLKEFLKRELLHLRSTGIMRKMATYLSTHSNFHGSSTSEEYRTVSIMHVFSIFIMLFAGLGASLIIFCIEIILKKRLRNHSLMRRKN